VITFKQHGNFRKLDNFLERMKESVNLSSLDKYGRQGVQLLMNATPVDTGLTASSWRYDIIREKGRVRLVFGNTNIQNGVQIAVILQYGHATGNGAWVEGRDYINPAIQPLFDEIVDNAWEEVRKA